MFIVSEP